MHFTIKAKTPKEGSANSNELRRYPFPSEILSDSRHSSLFTYEIYHGTLTPDSFFFYFVPTRPKSTNIKTSFTCSRPECLFPVTLIPWHFPALSITNDIIPRYLDSGFMLIPRDPYPMALSGLSITNDVYHGTLTTDSLFFYFFLTQKLR